MPQSAHQIVCAGGLDQVTPTKAVADGAVRGALNFELLPDGGYRRIGGYERFSGQLSPARALYWTIPFDNGINEISQGDHLVGTVSGASAKVYSVTVSSGDWSTSDAAGTLTLTNMKGQFVDNDNLVINLLSNGDWDYHEHPWEPKISAGTSPTIETELIDDGVRITVDGGIPRLEQAITVANATVYTYVVHFLNLNVFTAAACAFQVGTSSIAFDEVRVTATASNQVRTGSYGSSATTNYVNFVLLSSTPGHYMEIGAVAVGLVGATTSGTATLGTTAATLTAVQSYLRGLISTPSGSGPIRGLFVLKGILYAMRADSTGVLLNLWRSTPSGWEQVTYPDFIAFSSGTAAFTEGLVLTGGTSSATATIRRVVKTSGTWGSTAAGYLVVTDVSGTFTNGETLTDSSSGSATENGSGAETVVLVGNGKLQTARHNFLATTAGSAERVYGVDGVNPLWEFDGEVLVPIKTDGTPYSLSSIPSTDNPKWVAVHHNYLIVGFENGLYRGSAVLEPVNFDGTDGAFEGGLGQEMTGLQSLPGGTLAMLCRDKVFILFGSSTSDFVVREHSDTAGAVPYTVQRPADAVYLDRQGLNTLTAVQEFGDFASTMLSSRVDRFLQPRIRTATTAVRIREAQQYRVFFSDGTWLEATFNGGQLVGFMPGAYLDTPFVAISDRDALGRERLFFGSTAGEVFEFGVGNSFDGADIYFYLRFPHWSLGNDRVKKRWRRAMFDIESEDVSTFAANVKPEFARSARESGSSPLADITTAGGWASATAPGAGWEAAMAISAGASIAWSDADATETPYDFQRLTVSGADIDGTDPSLSLWLYGAADDIAPFTVQGLTITYSPRGMKRHA